jgi:hypothetical protein
MDYSTGYGDCPLPTKVQKCPVTNGKYKTDHNEIADFKTEVVKGQFK